MLHYRLQNLVLNFPSLHLSYWQTHFHQTVIQARTQPIKYFMTLADGTITSFSILLLCFEYTSHCTYLGILFVYLYT